MHKGYTDGMQEYFLFEMKILIYSLWSVMSQDLLLTNFSPSPGISQSGKLTPREVKCHARCYLHPCCSVRPLLATCRHTSYLESVPSSTGPPGTSGMFFVSLEFFTFLLSSSTIYGEWYGSSNTSMLVPLKESVHV